MSTATKKRLEDHLARLEAYSRQLDDHRDKLVGRAKEQGSTTNGAIDGWSEQVDSQAGQPGAILAHRRLRTLLRERQRCHEIVDNHEAQRAAKARPESL